ncbi:MAG TPA: hypothetical protein PLX99_16560 [Gammaproteobacteria bacterium]|nr:hypothetical protein [Gammaproteobacteria bacterium]
MPVPAQPGQIGEKLSRSQIGADGQVVVVAFTDNVTFEVLPAFENKDDSFTYPDSNNGGSWKVTNPRPEIAEINRMDKECNGNLKNLCKMARAWKKEWNVPISGLLIPESVFAQSGIQPKALM